MAGNMLQVNQPRGYGSMLSLEEKCEQSFFLFYYYRMEDEAVLDRGASFLKHVCDEEEVEGHHTIYIGVHVPKSYRRRRRHRRRTSHKERKEKVTEQTEEMSSSILKPTVRVLRRQLGEHVLGIYYMYCIVDVVVVWEIEARLSLSNWSGSFTKPYFGQWAFSPSPSVSHEPSVPLTMSPLCSPVALGD
ncbi:solute carrier family 4 member 4a isoform X1 [Tachysurus ichikawai]